MSDTNDGKKVSLTREEHETRALLLGMNYHDGNGDGAFYWKRGEDGIPITESMLDAETLEPLIIKERFPGGGSTYKYTTNSPEGRNSINRRHSHMWDKPIPMRKK